MSQFLDKVIAQKKHEIAQKTKEISRPDMRDRADQVAPARNFQAAIAGGQRIIAEIKKRSPAINEFRQAGSADVLPLLYEQNGASAVSVVTDTVNFGTSLVDAAAIRTQISLPVLVKDFVIDSYQVYEARSFGADALLLIARIVDSGMLRDLIGVANDIGMQTLVEVHSKKEIDKAVKAGAAIIGINNRDLNTLTVSLDTTRELISHVPDGITTVSESGISERQQIMELSLLGVDAFLVGGALLQSDDPAQVLQSLLGAAAVNGNGVGNGNGHKGTPGNA